MQRARERHPERVQVAHGLRERQQATGEPPALAGHHVARRAHRPAAERKRAVARARRGHGVADEGEASAGRAPRGEHGGAVDVMAVDDDHLHHDAGVGSAAAAAAGDIALSRCVTVRTPRSNARHACGAVAAVCPAATAMPRARSA